MQALLDAIREECSPQIWSRAVQLARSATLTGRQTSAGEYEVRVGTKGGMMSPLVTLSPEDGDWVCECPSAETVCPHAAAAVIALHQAHKQGQDLLGVAGPGATVAYRLARSERGLLLGRVLLSAEGEKELVGRLAAEKRRPEVANVNAGRADMEIDLLLGNGFDGPLPHNLLPRLFDRLAECDDVQLDGQPVEFDEPLDVLCARVEDHEEGFRITAAVRADVDERFENGAVRTGHTLRAVREPGLSRADLDALRRGRRFGFDQVADLAGRVLPKLREAVPVEVASKVLSTAQALPVRVSLATEMQQGVLSVLPTLVYGDPPSARVDAGKMTYLGGDLPLRDVEQEQRLQLRLERELGLEVGRRTRLEGEHAARLAERVAEFGDLHVSGKGLARSQVHGELGAKLSLEAERFGAHFETADGKRADAEAVVDAWQRDLPLVPLLDGGFAPLPSAWLQTHGHLLTDLLAARDPAEGALPACALPDLARLCAALDHPAPPELSRLQALTEEFGGIEQAPLPQDLTADLRDYQRRGVDWLRFVSDAGLGALLADDMGLGKTLQALCVLSGPSLIVCPASVLFNWRREAERFRPGLRVHTYHGPRRELDDDADLTLTTYAVMRIDSDRLGGRQWDTVVLDEAQTIKNADSQVAQAAFALKARFRIALTGTPVENRLEDLWSQMHFLNRGLLGGKADFRTRYALPISDGDAQMAARLRERTKPFVLRRLKRDVAKELPPRTDVVLRCTLDATERALYDTVRAATQRDVVSQLEAGGGVMAALEALLRLRQACCHRALLPGQKADRSSKLELLLATLEQVVAEGHKALIFSQWTSLLDLLEPALTSLDTGHVRLDGATRDREAVVQRFQEQDDVKLMLLSLKAGGTGLNLTAADHVFLLDPWWNPAAEDQAADRAHRIGQDRPVLVHRLIAENSVEERILELQEKKRALARAATEGGAAQGITREDLLALLQ